MKKTAWPEQARADVRRLDREVAMRIFEALHRFAKTGEGDIKKLKGEPSELRLRVATIASASLKIRPKPCAFTRFAIGKKRTTKTI